MTERENKPENKLESDRYEEFLGALELLYVRGNRGGRLNLVRDWPQVAMHILGEELIRFDTEGVVAEESREGHLELLEEKAEARWLSLLETVSTVPEKSAEKGVLKLEYVESVVKELGREIALCVYATRIVDRIIPPNPEEMSAPPSQNEVPETVSEEVYGEAVVEAKESVPSPFVPPEDIVLPEEPLEIVQPVRAEDAYAPPLPQKDVVPPSPFQSQPVEQPVDSFAEEPPLSHFARPVAPMPEDIKPIQTQASPPQAHVAAPVQQTAPPLPEPESLPETPLAPPVPPVFRSEPSPAAEKTPEREAIEPPYTPPPTVAPPPQNIAPPPVASSVVPPPPSLPSQESQAVQVGNTYVPPSTVAPPPSPQATDRGTGTVAPPPPSLAPESETPMVFMAAKRAVPPPAETTEESSASHNEEESKEPSQQPYASPFPPAEDESGQA